ncbi:MAG: NAD(P)/FAD-dependent oxidoreductase [Alphaproteobacteria bacterium]|nr:MAG: NAD(P)/FAD-dependent oxidoreductase [Alphaproteobacteria bacterium]
MVPSSVSEELDSVAIIGGGPAGLTCAYELQRLSPHHRPIVLEGSGMVGGIARTDSHNGYRFDIGGHRFFTKVGEVEQLWHEIMGEEFITVPRLSRIYYRGKYFDYPLKIFNALGNLGLIESIRIGLSVLRWQAFPRKPEETFEDWVVNRFGRRLFEHFFRSYTEKVWGVPCTEIRADWAAQRIKNLSLFKAVWNAISGANDTASLIEEFQYPRLGPGQMWERARARIREAGGEVRMRARVERVFREGGHVTGIEVAETDAETGAAQRYTLRAEHYVNSMALRELIAAFDPPPPAEVIAAASRLKYRDFMIVTLVLDHADPFPDNWIYVHEPQVQVGRIQNFRAWSKEMLPEAARETTASIGMEYFCNDTDPLWAMKDADLIALAAGELEKIGLAPAASVIDGCVIRQPKAYPVYDSEYADALGVVRDWLAGFDNFQTVGRNGQHRYNNQDHSMLTAMLAARNILGERHDIWAVNVERSYHEEFQTRPYKRREPAAA